MISLRDSIYRSFLIGDDELFSFEVFVPTFALEIVSERDFSSSLCPDRDDSEIRSGREIWKVGKR